MKHQEWSLLEGIVKARVVDLRVCGEDVVGEARLHRHAGRGNEFP